MTWKTFEKRSVDTRKRAMLMALMLITITVFPMFFLLGNEQASEPSSENEKDFGPGDSPGESDVVPGEVLVGFHDEIVFASAHDVVARHGGVVTDTIEQGNIVVVNIGEGDTDSFINEICQEEGVKYAEPNFIVRLNHVPTDFYFDEQNAEGVGPQWGPQNTGVDQVWDDEKGDEDTVIAIIDTGVDYNHEDLAGNMWGHNFHGWDFVNEDNTPSNPAHDGPMDDNVFFDTENNRWEYVFHGTHCAGIAAAEIDNGETGIAGIAQAKIMALKALDFKGEGSMDNILKAIYYAVDENADIISMSFSSPTDSLAEFYACQYAWNAGCLLVGASGNDGASQVSYPAALESVIAVGATDRDNIRCSFSNYGPKLELVAPGIEITSTKRPWTETPHNSYQLYQEMSGTSMATPHVAGVVALMRSANPSLTNSQIRSILAGTADDLAYSGDGWDQFTGFGKVNALAAVERARAFDPCFFEDFEVNGNLEDGGAWEEDFDGTQPLSDWDLYTSGGVCTTSNVHHSPEKGLFIDKDQGATGYACAVTPDFGFDTRGYKVSCYYSQPDEVQSNFAIMENDEISLYSHAGYLYLIPKDSNGEVIMSLDNGRWYHFEAEVYSNGTFYLFVDGIRYGDGDSTWECRNPNPYRSLIMGATGDDPQIYGTGYWDDLIVEELPRWEDTFQKDDLDGWGTGRSGGTCGVSTERFTSAPYSLKVNKESGSTGKAYAKTDYLKYDSSHDYKISFYFYLPDMDNNDLWIIDNRQMALKIGEGDDLWVITADNPDGKKVMDLPTSSWHLIELVAHPDTNHPYGGTWDLFVDQTPYTDTGGTAWLFRYLHAYDSLTLGVRSSSEDCYGTAYWDDIGIQDIESWTLELSGSSNEIKVDETQSFFNRACLHIDKEDPSGSAWARTSSVSQDPFAGDYRVSFFFKLPAETPGYFYLMENDHVSISVQGKMVYVHEPGGPVAVQELDLNEWHFFEIVAYPVKGGSTGGSYKLFIDGSFQDEFDFQNPTPAPYLRMGETKDAGTTGEGYWDNVCVLKNNKWTWIAADFDNDDEKELLHRKYSPLPFIDRSENWVPLQTSPPVYTAGFIIEDWLVGDFDGNGDDELLQDFKNHNSLYLSYDGNALGTGAVYTGGLELDMWISGNFDTDPKDELLLKFTDSTHIYITEDVDVDEIELTPVYSGDWELNNWIVGDFDNDGNDEIFQEFLQPGTGRSYIYYDETGYSLGSGGYKNHRAYCDGNLVDWLTGDFNGVGYDELLFIFDEGTDYETHYLSNLDPFQLEFKYDTETPVEALIAGDFDGDDDKEILQKFEGDTKIYRSEDGFSRGECIGIYTGDFHIEDWVVGDFDDDNDDEIFQKFHTLPQIYRSDDGRNLGTGGAPSSSIQYLGTDHIENWIAGDFDGDGMDELIHKFQDNTRIYRSEQDYNLGRNRINRYSKELQDWIVGDFDGDNHDEVLQYYGYYCNVPNFGHSFDGHDLGMNRAFWEAPARLERWIVGDFSSNSPGDEILLKFESDNRIYASDDGFHLERVIYDGNQRLENWLVGDFDTGGTDELLIKFRYSPAIYRVQDVYSFDADSPEMVYGDAGETDELECWIAGNFDEEEQGGSADGGDEVLLKFKDDTDIFRSEDARNLQSNPVYTEEYHIEMWIAGDFDGDGDDEVLQKFWGLTFIYLSDDGENLGTDVTDDTAKVYSADYYLESWITADFDGDGSEEIIQKYKGLPYVYLSENGYNMGVGRIDI